MEDITDVDDLKQIIATKLVELDATQASSDAHNAFNEQYKEENDSLRKKKLKLNNTILSLKNDIRNQTNEIDDCKHRMIELEITKDGLSKMKD